MAVILLHVLRNLYVFFLLSRIESKKCAGASSQNNGSFKRLLLSCSVTIYCYIRDVLF